MDKTIANKLIALRKQNGLSQADLAEKLGTDLPTVAGWESADISPDTENLLKLAKLYGVSLDRLFELNSDPVNQRSTISLDKNAGEIYPNAAPQYTAGQAASVQMPGTQYAEPQQDMSSYFRYETADEGAGLPAARQETSPAAGTPAGPSSVSDLIGRIQNDEKFYKSLMKFPYPIAALGAFLGGGALLDAWHPLWMLFLTIPLYYTTIEAIRKKNANIFCYPVFVTMMYLISGFLFDLWHPGWLTFLTIPLYYWLINAYRIGVPDDDDDENGKKKKKRRKK
ncbi:helix-turn-helix transcriptional regulator [Ruminococcus sp. HUN007]|uniref:helix-turn-helix transcriptional regulator n=1 Tax=Ruminococcus sp. HUN007 TaxID=1514668 RepID=UPI0005D29B26|nr:helix-turn-helix transcriptional regulator [Ruminococcus sp. HUN007]